MLCYIMCFNVYVYIYIYIYIHTYNHIYVYDCIGWECPNVWDFLFLAFRFGMLFHPKKHPFGASKQRVYLQIVSCFGCCFDKS